MLIITGKKHPETVSVQPPNFQKENRNTSVLAGIQRKLFEHWVRCSTSPQWLVIRCRIILALDDGKAKYRIAREQGKDIKTVRKWTKRWQTAKRELSKTEVPEMNHKEYKEYCKRLIAAIGDATRPGRPIIFTAEQVVQIIAMACEVRDGSDEAISHWTWGEIVSEAVSRGIVENMSCSSAGVF